MKAWNGNSLTDTETAHDGKFTTMALCISFLLLLSTELLYFLFLLAEDRMYNPPKCDSILSNLNEKHVNVILFHKIKEFFLFIISNTEFTEERRGQR